MTTRKALNRGRKIRPEPQPGSCPQCRVLITGDYIQCSRRNGHPGLHRMGTLYWHDHRGGVISADSFKEAERDLEPSFNK